MWAGHAAQLVECSCSMQPWVYSSELQELRVMGTPVISELERWRQGDHRDIILSWTPQEQPGIMRVCLKEKQNTLCLRSSVCQIGWSMASWLTDLEGEVLLASPSGPQTRDNFPASVSGVCTSMPGSCWECFDLRLSFLALSTG